MSLNHLQSSNLEREKNRLYHISSEIESYFCSGPLDVLEINCQEGLVQSFFKHRLLNCMLIDENDECIERLNQKIEDLNIQNITTRCGNIINLGIHHQFDMIYTSLSLHHDEQIEETIEHLYHLLKRDGKLIVVDMLPDDGVFHQSKHHTTIHDGFTINQMKDYLKGAGFKTIMGRKFYSSYEEIQDVNYPYSLFSVCGLKL